MNIFILSSRALASHVSWYRVFELENILVRTCNAQLLIPSARQWLERSEGMSPLPNRIVRKVIKSTTGFYKLDSLPELSNKPNVLLTVGLSGADLELLSSIPNWRQRFDVVIGYVFDAWDTNSYSKNV